MDKKKKKAYKERISDNPSRSAFSEYEEATDTPIAGDLRHREVCSTDTPGPSTERQGDINIGVAS